MTYLSNRDPGDENDNVPVEGHRVLVWNVGRKAEHHEDPRDTCPDYPEVCWERGWCDCGEDAC